MTDPRSQPREHDKQPLPNQGTAAVSEKPQEQKEKEPIPNQQQEDEQLTEYLVKEEGYVRPAAESELARDRDSVKAKKQQFDQDQKKKDQQTKDQQKKDQQAKDQQQEKDQQKKDKPAKTQEQQQPHAGHGETY